MSRVTNLDWTLIELKEMTDGVDSELCKLSSLNITHRAGVV